MDIIQDATTVERALMTQASQNRVPINGSIELSPLCNMNCDMCYVRLSREEMEKQGRLRSAEEWLEIAKQMQKAGVLFLLLTGGEPFLYPEFRKLYLELLKMGFIITINTNATLIDEEWAEFLGKHKPRRINITLYGADEETYKNLCHHSGGFEKTLHAIRLLRKNNVDVKVGGSLTRANQQDIDRIIDLGKELDVPVRIDTYMMPATRERSMPYNMQSRVEPEKAARIRIRSLQKEMGPEIFRQYVNQTLEDIYAKEQTPRTRHMSCFAGKCSFTINWQGEMRPCVILTKPAISVFEAGFENAWKYIVEETDKILINEKCCTCKMRSLCRTCAASGLLEAGAHDAVPEYMCRYTEESLRIIEQLKETML